MILKKRHDLYQEARKQNLSRWSRKTKNWNKKATVEFPSLKGLPHFAKPDAERPNGRRDNDPETYPFVYSFFITPSMPTSFQSIEPTKDSLSIPLFIKYPS
jgi:hypothetical protein